VPATPTRSPGLPPWSVLNADTAARWRARRILEFDASTHSAQSWKGGRESIELWDCSGDKKYEKCFPAIMKGAVGVILVYNPDDQEHLAQLQYWHDKMIRPMKLNDEQVIVFQHRPQATFLPPKERKGAAKRMPRLISASAPNRRARCLA
jgi:hypothetical protein